MACLILNFHGLGRPPAGISDCERRYWLPASIFENVLDEILEPPPRTPPVFLTFDDGNRSDLEIALPALLRRGIRATFFVCAGRLGRQDYVNAAGLRALAAEGMSIGSHGYSHVDWRRLDEADLDVELEGARRRLEDALGAPIVEASIPFGSYDRRVLARLRSGRWRAVYCSDGGLCSDAAWLRPRQTLDRSCAGAPVLPGILSEPLLRRLRRRATCLAKSVRGRP